MIVLAFPGTGKTYLSKLKGSFVDLDYDHFRRAGNELGLEDWQILSFYATVAKRMEKNGFVVLINEPAVLDKTALHVDRMYVPANANPSAIKLGVTPMKALDWITDWRAAAVEHKIPVITTTGPLAHYIRGNRP